MKQIYGKLAATNIKNNKQFYLPYLLTGGVSVMMFYTMASMAANEAIGNAFGGNYVLICLRLGQIVMGLLVTIFLFYTNSFIMKRRKKELGIYNILGMEKKHISKVLFLENMITSFISLVGGLAFGIMFNKFLMMFLYKLIQFDTAIHFTISRKGIVYTVVLFEIIYGITLIYNLLQVKLANPIELLRGGNVGEKEPKTKIVMTILGVLCIGAGYYISITTKSPLEALVLFFVAVMLVIVGTYCLFTAGSIAFLKLLRKNKNFYYKTSHFTAVSGMLYRMKQNAVGLANICILSTMVLVMLSASVSMFVGIEDELENRYPSDINIQGYTMEITDCSELLDIAKEVIKEQGNTITAEKSYLSLDVTCLLEDNEFVGRDVDMTMSDFDWSDLYYIKFCTKETGENIYEKEFKDLNSEEVYILGYPAYQGDTVSFFGEEFKVVESEEYFPKEDAYMAGMMGGVYYVMLPNEAEMDTIYGRQQEAYGDYSSNYMYHAYLDLESTQEEKIRCSSLISEKISDTIYDENHELYQKCFGFYTESRDANRGDFYTLNGSLLFLGIFLGIMFLMITCLIIYFKQISEGYEDKERFVIMQKVGMSRREVKSSISTQIRLVFFLPIIVAAIHVAAAYPIIVRLLALLNLTNVSLFAVCLAGTILVFAIIYFVMFKLTSRSYYRIVGNMNRA